MGGPTWRNTDIGPDFQRNLKLLDIFLRILESRLQNYWRTRKFNVFKDGIRQSSNPTDIDIV